MAFVLNRILLRSNRVLMQRFSRQSLSTSSQICNPISSDKYYVSKQRTIAKCSAMFCTQTTKTDSLDDFRNREEIKEQTFNEENDKRKTLTESSEQTNADEADKIKQDILKASMQFVPAHGFTKEAIMKGAESMKYPGTAHGLFPNGGIELIQYFTTTCNKNLIEQLKTQDIPKKGITREYIKNAIQIRLLMLEPYLSSWPQALALMSLPPNVPNSIANLLTMVDDICYYAGDRSVDFNWYIRRVGLAGIYKSTELYMLQDSSPNFSNTWNFLDQRLAEASVMHKFLAKSEETTHNLQNAVVSVFTTARNIVGVN